MGNKEKIFKTTASKALSACYTATFSIICVNIDLQLDCRDEAHKSANVKLIGHNR